MPDQTQKKNTTAKVPEHVFIAQGPEAVQQDHSRLVSSQARRFQSACRRQQQRLAAKNGAGYALSLVGWRPTSSGTDTVSRLSISSVDSRKRASLSQSKPKSPERSWSTKELEQGQTSEAQIGLAIRTGIRSDPFCAFPSSNTKTAMLQVDYYIHVWAPHKAGNFDDLMGYNTQLDLCWPVALQDDMLFDATLAVSRTAWVLAQGKNPSEDQFMLHHSGLAMTSLRQKLCSTRLRPKEAVLFTIGRMISIAYMSSEPDAFIAHFDAFSKLTQKYIDDHPKSDTAQVLENRLDSWKALHGYRTGQNLLCSNSSNSRSPSTSAPQSRQSTPLEGQLRARSPTLLSGLDFSVGMAQSIQLLIYSLRRLTGTRGATSNLTLELVERAQRFRDTLFSSDDLTATDLQLCCALVAFCQQLHCHLNMVGQTGETRNEVDVLNAVSRPNNMAKTFIYQKLDGFSDSNEQRMALTWSALVLGSFLLRQSDARLRTKGHIIHVNLSLHLGLGSAHQYPRLDEGEAGDYGTEWTYLESLLAGSEKMGALWYDDLVPQWRCDWQGSMKRQRRWEKQGVWMIGAPKRLPCHGGRGASASTERGRNLGHARSPSLSATMQERYGDVDIIEYLILREARDSLPRVE